MNLNAMNEAVRAFDQISPLLLTEEMPFYAVGGLVLSVASVAELVVVTGLETHSAWAEARGDADEAELIGPDILKYVRSLISAPRLVDAEVGRWRQ